MVQSPIRRAEAQAKAHQANHATAEAFAANVLPVVRQIQAAGVSGLKNIANALNDRHRARRRMAQQHGAQPAGAGMRRAAFRPC
jgi:hypothetical protein